MLRADQLTRTYPTAEGPVTVLSGVSFHIAPGETCAVVGPSGSGKTTLLGLCAGLDQATSGSVSIGGQNLGTLSEDERAKLRSRHVGFVFQNFQLLPGLTALENVLLPLELRGDKSDRKAAAVLLERVGLGHRLSHYPTQLSGGEQQRVALARAFIHRPGLLFADEPTGNLDAEARKIVEDMLFDLNREAGTTLMIVTHDLDLARRTGRVLSMRAGEIVP